MQQFEKCETSYESYEIISKFTEMIIDVPEFIEQVEKEGDIIHQAKLELNADKGHDLPWRAKKEHNEQRDKKGKALHELDPIFPLRNLNHVLIATKIENIPDNVDWLYAKCSPNEPMTNYDKKEYKMFMNKMYKKILPFIDKIENPTKPTKKKEKVESLRFKKYDENTRTLHIGKYSIQIAKNEGNNKMHEVMAYIFIDHKDDITQEFFYAEIAEERFGEPYNTKDKYAHQPYSGACKRINNKIQLDTNGKIKDFLNYNTSRLGSVTVNEKYL